jgi:branched-chain amino acid transport system ATP-binding protein
MLDIKKLNAGYGNLHIFKDVDFNVNKGEIVSIISPNGVGKSTLLKSIFTLCDIYSGKIILNNINITTLKTHQPIKKGISYSPQGRQVFQNLTGHKNIEMGLYIFKDKKEVIKRIEKIFKRFPVLEEKNKYAYSLSGGQQQILSIARSLLHEPSIMLLDEPSLELDPKTQQTIFKIIKEINKEGITIIIVEQNAKAAAKISNVIYVLEDGKIALKGNKSLLKDKKIKNVYFSGR